MYEQTACYGKGVAVRAAALEALAITTFVACNDPAAVDKCMTGFVNLWKSGQHPSKVCAQLLPECFSCVNARQALPNAGELGV